MWGVDPQVDGQVGDALRGASHPVRLVLDLLHDGEEVHELLALAVQELSILRGSVDKLKDEGASCDNPRTTGEEVPGKRGQSQRRVDALNCDSPQLPSKKYTVIFSDGRYLLAHKVLQDRGLAGTLSAHHCNLGQVDGVGDAELGEDVLQPIHDGDEGLHPLVTRRHP